MSHPLGTNRTQVVSKGLESGVVVGIDPGLDRHGVVALVAGSCYPLARRMIANRTAGMQFLAKLLSEWRAQGADRLTIGIEEATAFGEALECYLAQAGFKVVVVSPLKVARFREAIGIDANDLSDAEAIARLLMVQPDLGQAPIREAVQADQHGCEHRRLRQLARRHERWTREKTALCNELHAVLRMAWLADYQGFFSRVDGVAALTLWQTYPTPAEAVAANPAELAGLIRKVTRGRINAPKSREKAKLIRSTARFLTVALGQRDANRWSAWAVDIRMLAKRLAELKADLKQLEQQMALVLEAIHSAARSFKGLGTVIAARIHGETLSIHRFATADRFARYNGTAPREDSSGRRPRQVKNYRCNKRLKQALMQLALTADRYHEESAKYLEHLRAKGITGGAARLRLARRLSDIIYAMLKANRAYDLDHHLKSRRSAA